MKTEFVKNQRANVGTDESSNIRCYLKELLDLKRRKKCCL